LPYHRWRVAACACVLLAAAACGSTSPGAQTIGAGESQAATFNQRGLGTAPVDSCAQITPAEVSTLLGRPIAGVPRANGGSSTCIWENPESSYSITLEIGASGSAPGGRVPPQDLLLTPRPIAGADGMVLVAGDQVMFAAKDRVCSIQVVTDVTKRDKDHTTAVRLAREVQAKI
jgi:hypothetical protein